MANMQTLDDEWENFMLDDNKFEDEPQNTIKMDYSSDDCNEIISADVSGTLTPPKPGDIYISTKSKISYLNTAINLNKVFWGIPIIPYARATEGVIKKQMKFNSFTQEELDEIQSHLKNENYYDEQVITSINNPTGRIKFKDIRKISVGVSKKDILSYRCKQKSAFYNCFVMIMRIKENEAFKEFHVKVFNTGKIEIPGVQNDDTYNKVLEKIIIILQPFSEVMLSYKGESITVLINSNFNCGFFINREKLYDILKYKYQIQCIYDPCSYPGIQSKFYYNPHKSIEEQNGVPLSAEELQSCATKPTEVSFMIFRTGSILIVGMCNEPILYIIYEFIKNILCNEFSKICQMVITDENRVIKDKAKKVRKKTITIDVE